MVVGDFSGDISAFYGTSFTAALGGGFVAKYNASGTLIWAFKIGENDDDRCNAVSIDASGNIYVAGYIKNSCDFQGLSAGSNSLTSIGGRDAFLAKYTSAGMNVWAKKGGGAAGDDEALSVCVNATNVFITGYYKNAATFGIKSTFSAENHDDIFVVSYDLNGSEQWLADAGATGNGYGYDITANNTDVYVSGDYKNILNIFNSTGVLSATSAAGANFEGFVIDYSTAGNFVWFDQITGGGEGHVNSCKVSGANVFITGSIDNSSTFPGYASNPVVPTGSGQDFYVASLNKATGATQWVKCETGSNDQIGHQVDVDFNGNVITTGLLDNNMTFGGGPTFTSLGNVDVFVASYSSAGAFNWATQTGGGDHDVGHGFACSNTIQDIYVVGESKLEFLVLLFATLLNHLITEQL